MAGKFEMKEGPLVSVLIPTFNRRRTLPVALSSVLRQEYRDIEVFVVRDGGQSVSDIVGSFNDPRINFIDRDENRGKAFSLNEALMRAKGKYVAYLDDDDLYYGNHVGILVDRLENRTDCKVAYSDLYRTYCRTGANEDREVLGKVLEVSRDFDRFVMLYFNHTLHVSMMHHRDLLDKTGPYNESLGVLIDWDFSRKALFFSDFCHVCEITGEYFSPVGDSDRISVVRRRNQDDYLRDVMTIRTTRPAKPWTMIDDVSIILDAERFDQQLKGTLLSIWRHTFYPYQVYLPLPEAEIATLNIEMPNIVTVPVGEGDSRQRRIDRALAICEGQYTAVVPSGFSVGELWLEESLYPLVNGLATDCAIKLEGSNERFEGFVVETDDLRRARNERGDLSISESLEACGVHIRGVLPEEIPFQLDQSLAQARLAGRTGRLA